MQRRRFALVALAALAAPCLVLAQPAKVARIGWLSAGSAEIEPACSRVCAAG